MKTIEVEQIPFYIEQSPIEMNLLFVGDSGVGKTVIIERWAKENNYKLKTLILSQLEASETLGIPIKSEYTYNNKTYKTIEQAIPMWVFELKEALDSGQKAVLFLDEFLNAQPDVQNAFLNFLTSKMVDDIDLSNLKIIAATNIGEYTFEPSHNVLSRFCMFETINTNYQKYLKSDIRNNYTGIIEDKTSVVFQSRELKPRCEEWLLKIEDKSLMPDFYEGFTNQQYIKQLFKSNKMHQIFLPFVECDDARNVFILDESNYKKVASIVVSSYPRMKQADSIYSDKTNYIEFNMQKLIEETNKLLQQ